MTQQLSVQYSTMQISFIHILLNIHIVFWKQNVTESTHQEIKSTVSFIIYID